jgi:hypothetical protein
LGYDSDPSVQPVPSILSSSLKASFRHISRKGNHHIFASSIFSCHDPVWIKLSVRFVAIQNTVSILTISVISPTNIFFEVSIWLSTPPEVRAPRTEMIPTVEPSDESVPGHELLVLRGFSLGIDWIPFDK